MIYAFFAFLVYSLQVNNLTLVRIDKFGIFLVFLLTIMDTVHIIQAMTAASFKTASHENGLQFSFSHKMTTASYI